MNAMSENTDGSSLTTGQVSSILDQLWKILSSATNIKQLEYDEIVTIGSV